MTEALSKPIDRSTISRMTERLLDPVEALRTRATAEPTPYRYLDAHLVGARWVSPSRDVAASLGALESEVSWAALLGELVARRRSDIQTIGEFKLPSSQLPSARCPATAP